MPVQFDLSAYKTALDTLRDNYEGDERRDILKDAATQAAIVFDMRVRNTLPPPTRKRSQSQNWTAKQRKWWWATMNAKAKGESQALPGWTARYVDGELRISGAYRRTGKGIQSLTYKVNVTSHDATIRYGTNRAYMRYVIDKANQADYHKGNWPTLQTLRNRYEREIVTAFGERVYQRIGGR